MKLSALALFLIALCAALPATAQTPTAPAAQPSSGAVPAATATMLQKRAEDFLRNVYAWGPEFEVKAGEVKQSVVPDLYEISVEVSLNGQSDSAVVYVTKDGRYMVRGDISDMNADPFAETRQKLVLDGSPSMGPQDASVVIVEFGDFECPSCRQLDLVLRQLLPENPKVRLVFKDFPLETIHPWAMTASLVGRCAYEKSPDTFWKVHDLIYDNQDQITPDKAYDKLVELGTQAGLDPKALRSCVDDPKTTALVRKSIEEGKSLDVHSTPTSFVNGRQVVGANEPALRQYIKFIQSPSSQ
jgi:protein-disulfide isomerase